MQHSIRRSKQFQVRSRRLQLISILAALPALGCAVDAEDPMTAEAEGTSGSGRMEGTSGVADAGETSSSAAGGMNGSSGSPADWTYDCDGTEVPHGCLGGFCLSCTVPARGIPFVEDLFYVVDDATQSQPILRSEPGRACISGTVSEIATFILGFGDEIDAEELGITGVGFSIESPPSGGLEPAVAAWGSEGEPSTYLFLDTPAVTTTDPVTLPLSSVEPAFDATRMVAIQFFLPAHVRADYDFCVKDLELLDAEGREVSP